MIDVRALNEFVEYIPFRMEDILLKSVLKQGDCMTQLYLLKGRLSNCPSGQKIKNLSSLHLEGCTPPIHLPPFWSLFFRQNFHQSNEASDCISKSHGDKIINFLDNKVIMVGLDKYCREGNREQ